METGARGREGPGDYAARGEGARRDAPAAPGAAPAGLTCDGVRRVALEEMALRRRRLGALTPAQERALESLLLSVADNICGLVSAAAAVTSRGERAEEACAPATVRPAAVNPAHA